MKRFIVVTLFCSFFLSGALAHAKIIDRIVARVNDNIITLYDVRAAVPYLLQEGRDPAILQNPTKSAPILKEVLDDLINRKLIVQESKKIELSVSDQELEQWLGLMRQQRQITEPQFKQLIEGSGVKYDTYKAMVRENLLRIQMVRIKIGSQVSISQSEVDAVYQQRYGADGGREKFITVSHILFQPDSDSPEDLTESKKSAALAIERLDKGEDFADVARDMSEGPTGPGGGALGTFRRGDLDPEFEAVAFNLKPGSRSGIVKTKFGFHVIKVTGVELRDAPDIEERKDRIQMELRASMAQRLLDEYVAQLRSRAFVDVQN